MLFTHSRARARDARGARRRGSPTVRNASAMSVGRHRRFTLRTRAVFFHIRFVPMYFCTSLCTIVLSYGVTDLFAYSITKEGGLPPSVRLHLFFFSRRPRAVTPVVARLLVALLALSSLSNRSLFIVGWLSRSNLRASFPLNTNVCALQAIFGLLCAFAPKVI